MSHRYILLLWVVLLLPVRAQNTSITVAAFNVENYLLEPAGNRPLKSPVARAAVRESIRAIHPDVLALEEMGSTNALLELRSSLRAEGLDYPYWTHVSGYDTNIFVAVLSRLPITADHSHTNVSFLLNGRRYHTSRGFAELDLKVNDQFTFTLLSAHLKSRRAVGEADQEELREQEAVALRGIIDEHLRERPDMNLVVLGDFNDTRDSKTVRTLIGRGKLALVDTRPAERRSDSPASSSEGSREVTWTYFYAKQDAYERIDYILLSRQLARRWNPGGSYVLARPGWGDASDHRPVVVSLNVSGR